MDRESLPRVPDTHGDVVDEKLFSDLYIRTSWVDAQVALDQIDKVSEENKRVTKATLGWKKKKKPVSQAQAQARARLCVKLSH